MGVEPPPSQPQPTGSGDGGVRLGPPLAGALLAASPYAYGVIFTELARGHSHGVPTASQRPNPHGQPDSSAGLALPPPSCCPQTRYVRTSISANSSKIGITLLFHALRQHLTGHLIPWPSVCVCSDAPAAISPSAGPCAAPPHGAGAVQNASMILPRICSPNSFACTTSR